MNHLMPEPTNAELIERWEQCLRVLEQMPEHERRHHFSMETIWCREAECGTVTCAAGRCGLDSWFRERGFLLGKCSEHPGSPDGCNRSDCDAYVLTQRPDAFFGRLGAQEILYNSEKRPVETVIEEVKSHIAKLRGLNIAGTAC